MSPRQCAELSERAQSALRNSPLYDLRELNVEVVEDRLLIRGSVSSYYHKQLAQELLRSVAGPLPIVNTVAVADAEVN